MSKIGRMSTIIPNILSNSKKKKNFSEVGNYMEKRLEIEGLPIVILPGKKNRSTLNKWVKTKMWKFPEGKKGLFVYFDKEPVHEEKVDGFVIKLCSDTDKSDFEFKPRYYKISPYKFDKIKGAQDVFQYVNNYKNETYTKTNDTIVEKTETNLFDAYDNLGHIKEKLFKTILDNGINDDISLDKGIIKKFKESNNTNKHFYVSNYTSKFSKNFFDIEAINSIEVLKQKGAYLYFELNRTTGKSKRIDFHNAISDGNFGLAKKLYLEALNLTRNKLERIGLTPEQNKFIIDCFRERNFRGIKEILDKTKNVVGKNMQVEDTKHRYSKITINKETGQEEIEYDNKNKAMYKDPITGKESMMTRRELHERIIDKFLLDGEASKGKKKLVLSGGLPGSGKSTIEETLKDIPKVVINPDLVKDYLPEYYDEYGRKFGAEIVHEESSSISKIIYDRAVRGGYSILYDSSMKDNPSEGFPKYNKIVQSAYEQGYLIEARFIYDGGEAWYRNTVIRERSMGLKNYNAYGTAYKTIEYLSRDKRVNNVIIYDNSGNGKISLAQIVYENQNINLKKSDEDFIRRFDNYQSFLDKLL